MLFSQKTLSFHVETPKNTTEAVCEGSFLFMLGYISTQNVSDANSLWQAQRLRHMGIAGTATKMLGMKTGAKSLKRLNAEAFLRYLKVLYFGDDFVTKEGVDKVNQ